ncbi:MAG: GAF domain-containing protein [Actinomycetota bacterium]|nr:MAG: GAF domain-containing protein [Actinomycetota bacterium]
MDDRESTYKSARTGTHPNRPGQITGLFKWLPKNSMARDLRNTFVELALILLIMGGVGTGALMYSNSANSDLVNRLEPLTSTNNNMLIEVLEMDASATNYMRTGDTSYLTIFQKDQSSYWKNFNSAQALENQKERKSGVLQNENSAAQNLFELYTNSVLAVPPDQLSPELIDTILPTINPALNNFESYYSASKLLFSNEKTQEQNRLHTVAVLTIGASLLIFLGGLALGLRRVNSTRLKMESLLLRLTETLSRLEAGETSVRAPIGGLAEETVLAAAINSMADEKESLISQLEGQYTKERELREGLEMERSLREELANALFSDHDVTAAFQQTVSGLGPALKADRTIVRMFENGVPGPIICEWFSPAVGFSSKEKLGDSTLGKERTAVFAQPGVIHDSLQNGSVIAVDDIANDPRLSDETRATVLRTGLGAFLTAPVLGSHGPEAILVAAMDGKARNWSERDIQVAKTMASGLAATLTAIRLYEQERTSLEAMKKLDESKDFFLASVSHELRTPLTSIIGYLELLQDELDEGKISRTYSRMLDAIDRNSKRLLDLIDNILTTSRIESGNLQLTKSRIHITPLLMRTAEAVMPQIKSKNIDFKINVLSRVPDLDLDTALIERVLLNLLSNAIKFTPPEGTISLAAEKDGDSLAIIVTDSGVGIPEEELQNLFTKFYRTTVARENAVQGTGLGLIIIKAVVEQHGGTISVTSKIGEGTTFKILLPLIDSKLNTDNAQLDASKTSPGSRENNKSDSTADIDA